MAHKTSLFFQKKKVFVAAAALAGMTSWMACTKFDLGVPEIQANPEFATAIGKFSFLFSDFIKGDSLIKVGVDSSIALKYAKDSIAGYSVLDVVNRATGGVGGAVTNSTTLGAVAVQPLNMSQATTLSTFGAAFPPPSLMNTFCTAPTTIPVATGPFTSSTTITNNLAQSTDYQTITLSSGTISIQLTNNFPFPIDSVTVEIFNTATPATVIAAISVTNNANPAAGIAALGGVGSGSKSLAGKTLTDQLSYRIGTFRSAGMAAGTTSNPAATMAVVVTTSNMKISSGNVKIPAQSLKADTILASMATSNVDQKLVEISLNSATISGTITKTTPVRMTLTLNFPSIKQYVGGQWVDLAPQIIQMTGGANSSAPININLNNTRLNLASNVAQPYNQLPITVSTTIIASTGFEAIDQSQQVNVNANFGNIQVGGAKGQFGNFDIAIPATNQDFGADFGFLSPESMRLFFTNPSLRIKTTNSFGLTINTDLLMSATGFLPGTEKLGRGAGNVGFTIARPTIAQIATPAQLVTGAFSVDSSNSNIKNFMSILPKKIAASGTVSIRSLGLVPGPAANLDYFTADSRIKLGLEMDIPMKFSAENLIVRDTVTAFANTLPAAQVQYVEYVAMDIQYKTRLPLGVTVDLATLVNGVITPVVTGIVLPAADAIDANGKVTAQKAGAFEVKITAAQLSQLSDAPKVVLVAKIKTAKGGLTPVAMFTHYDFDMGIGMRIKTKIVK
jgi:hypothetical protein